MLSHVIEININSNQFYNLILRQLGKVNFPVKNEQIHNRFIDVRSNSVTIATPNFWHSTSHQVQLLQQCFQALKHLSIITRITKNLRFKKGVGVDLCNKSKETSRQ